MITKGKWTSNGRIIQCEPNGSVIATTNRYPFKQGEGEANAKLIAAAVNACIKLNPDNPMAVAENLSDLYEALKNVLFDLQHGFFGDSPLVSDRQEEIEKALLKAE